MGWKEFLGWFEQESILCVPDIHSLLVAAWNRDFRKHVASFCKAWVLTLLWCLWTQMSNCIFDEKSFAHKRIIHAIRVAFLDMEQNFRKLGCMKNICIDLLVLKKIGVKPRASPPPSFLNVHWWPPPIQWIKVNTDGSALGATRKIAAGGGVFRDNFSWVRGCFHIKGGIGFAFEAELLTVITAVQIAYSRNWRHLWIESDSTYIVNLMQSRSLDVLWRFVAS
ncbi:uncharacterized protein LOC131004845 [Salvia miltiorrhiza]|uniref:uncharacterized protein LOC131004845 n=1 Tax=Salvia miltiorrhiza TaxID=226208 RepID=UPI0025AC4C5B|nr:uncharacterized protein LOC131004845 [Salvia miltiorrhiza]